MADTTDKPTSLWFQLMPGVFVFLWSTGFIGAKYGLPYAEPLTFLLYRFIIVLMVLTIVAFGITLGTIYQKAFVVGEDLRTSGVLQFADAVIVVGVGAFSLETMRVEWTPQFIGALAWLVIVLSLGAISLLILIIRHGEVSRIATLFYLVPPVTALIVIFRV